MTAEPVFSSLDADFNEKQVVAGCSDGLLRVYACDGDEFQPLVNLSGHAAPVTKAVYAGKGEWIVSADFSGKVCLWRLEGGSFVKRLERQVSEGPVHDIAARLDGAGLLVACGCDGGVLSLLRIDGGLGCTQENKPIHRYGISAVSCNDEVIVSGSVDFSVAIVAGEETKFFKIHKAIVNAVAVAPSNHLHRLVFASCAEDGRLVITVRTEGDYQHQVIEIGEPCSSLSWSKSGLILAVGCGMGSVKYFILGDSGEYEETGGMAEN